MFEYRVLDVESDSGTRGGRVHSDVGQIIDVSYSGTKGEDIAR